MSKKEIDRLAEALRTAIEAAAGSDPRAAREAVQRARDALDGAEAAVIRAALTRCGWRVKPASDLLGFPRHSALQKLLEPGRRHAAIGEEIAQHRDETGYHLGRPPTPAPTPAKEIPPVGQKVTPRRGRNAPRG